MWPLKGGERRAIRKGRAQSEVKLRKLSRGYKQGKMAVFGLREKKIRADLWYEMMRAWVRSLAMWGEG